MFSQDLKIKLNSFAWCSPFSGDWLGPIHGEHFENLFGEKFHRGKDFIERIKKINFLPERVLINSFVGERFSIVSLCRELNVTTAYGESGFFPHNGTMHLDPLGFAWESSLSRMIFRSATQNQRESARRAREEWMTFEKKELPQEIKKPFVLWATQLIKDKVNTSDLNVKEWGSMITHFRQSLPEDYQLVIKPHPLGPEFSLDFLELMKGLKNVIVLPKKIDLKTLLFESSGVAGANSSVLYEARLMFQKPVYAYARSWLTNHEELFVPVQLSSKPGGLFRIDYLANDEMVKNERLNEYSDWFLANLLSRQIRTTFSKTNPKAFKDFVLRVSFNSYQKYGEEIFL